MCGKVYVSEKVERTVDGEELMVVQVIESKPKKFTYLVFLEK